MKLVPLRLLVFALLLSFDGSPLAQEPTDEPIHPPISEQKAPHFMWLGLGEVKPLGWIQEQMARDLKEGFAGRLDKLCPEARSDIFATGRNSLAQTNSTNKSHNTWWNGETEGNWRAGFIMMAYLSGDADSMAKADAYVAHILAAQDSDGYLGINAPELRYTNGGELWTQACLLRGLLDYAELTGRDDVLKAVEKAVQHTILVLTSGQKPMRWRESHDLMFCDVLERLYDLTEDASYRDFGVWLYKSYSQSVPGEDASIASLLNRYSGLMGHGVRTYEHLRVPLWLWSVTGNEELDAAWRNGFNKLARYNYPGGAAVSQEDIGNSAPNPTLTEFEYCAAKEVQWDLESALQKTGSARFGDQVELLWFNDEQSGRLADGSALTYLTNENRFQIDDLAPDGKGKQPRNRYSPTQAQVAVCCPPNATQVAALYVRGMWMRQGNSTLAALLYGPCAVSTKVNGVPLKLVEKTNYPFENTVTIQMQSKEPVEMTLLLRNPAWSGETTLVCEGAEIVRDGMYWEVHKKKWEAGDTVQIAFTPTVQMVLAVNAEAALQYGALVFAKPIPAKETVVSTYPVDGFKDLHFEPTARTDNVLALPDQARWPLNLPQSDTTEETTTSAIKPFKVRHVEGANLLRPFDSPALVLEGTMLDTANQNTPQSVTLVPLGNANQLRRVTFPIFSHSD
jgi:uncharacterized protein